MPGRTSGQAGRDVQINWFVQGYVHQVLASVADTHAADNRITFLNAGIGSFFDQGVGKALIDMESMGGAPALLNRLADSDHYGTDDRQALINRIRYYLRQGRGSLSGANILAGNFHF